MSKRVIRFTALALMVLLSLSLFGCGKDPSEEIENTCCEEAVARMEKACSGKSFTISNSSASVNSMDYDSKTKSFVCNVTATCSCPIPYTTYVFKGNFIYTFTGTTKGGVQITDVEVLNEGFTY